MDFAFVGPTSKVIILAILSEEFNTPPILRILDIDPINSSFISDPAMVVIHTYDIYKIIPCDLENSSLIIALSSEQVIHFLYDGLTLTTTTAAIVTPFPIIEMFPMSHNFSFATYQSLTMWFIKLEEPLRN